MRNSGQLTKQRISLEDFLESLPKKLPLRDARLLVRSPSSNVKRLPALLPRPSADCFILDMEHIRLLCYKDRALVFSPDREITRSFLQDLVTDLQSGVEFRSLKNHSITKYYQSSRDKKTDFEHIILESSLDNVVKKFKRHLEIIKPALDSLLHTIAQEPATYNLRRLLGKVSKISPP